MVLAGTVATTVARSKVNAFTSGVIKRICQADLIVVDDIGMLPAGQAEAEALYRLVDAANEKRPLAVTSSFHPSGLPPSCRRPWPSRQWTTCCTTLT